MNTEKIRESRKGREEKGGRREGVGGEKEAGKEEKHNRWITDKGRGGRERTAWIHFTHAATYISTSTPIIQYGLTPLVLTG